MFSVENLTKRFGASTAVDNASFTVDAPRMIGIIGRSGAGKSTETKMRKLIAAMMVTTAIAAPATALEITDFRIGILGCENAQYRMASNECNRSEAEELLGVPVKLFARPIMMA